MAEISAALVKELRERSGAGMMDCKKALQATDGDMEKAAEWLREKGLASAGKKASRVAADGVVDAYVHMGGRIGVLVEVNCETDFVARTDDFQNFVHDVAMHVAAASPRYVSKEEVPAAEIEKERDFLKRQALEEGKPEHILEKVVEGRLEKHLASLCLMDQDFVKNPDLTISDLVKETIAKLGENIQIRRFVRYEMGEGLEKKADDFAEEVKNMSK